MNNPKCPFCGEEMLLVGSKAYGWHYICNCGAASPVASDPDEAYAAAMKRDESAVPHEMTAREFAIQYDRMCKSNRCRLSNE